MRHDESNLQRACVKWFRLQYPQYARLLFAVPNGGARSAATGAALKAEGVVAGVADLILLVPRGKPLFIELKTKNGKQSLNQKEWQKDVEGVGYDYIVVRRVEEFTEAITSRL